MPMCKILVDVIRAGRWYARPYACVATVGVCMYVCAYIDVCICMVGGTRDLCSDCQGETFCTRVGHVDWIRIVLWGDDGWHKLSMR